MGEADSGNIIALLISKGKENLYKLSIKHLILNQLYTTKKIAVCKKDLIAVNEGLVNEINQTECSHKNFNLCGIGFQ